MEHVVLSFAVPVPCGIFGWSSVFEAYVVQLKAQEIILACLKIGYAIIIPKKLLAYHYFAHQVGISFGGKSPI